MAIPPRSRIPDATYFTTSSTDGKKRLLQSDRMALLFIDVLLNYREQQKFLLHEFVVMPHHFHLLLTPSVGVTLERSLQLIKGGFSFRANKEFRTRAPVWQTSFHDRRVRDGIEYQNLRNYIHQNPVTAGLCVAATDFPFGSASGRFPLDEIPQRLKPASRAADTQG